MEELVRNQERYKKNSIYLNITNQCPCSCVFCVRSENFGKELDDLWLETEPDVEDVIMNLKKINLTKFKEVVFCGYGEPLTRLEELLAIAQYLKDSSDLKIRINTNGLGNLIHSKNIIPSLAEYIDSVSISLNASNEEEYLKLTNCIYGKGSFRAMLEFACECKKYLEEVRVSVVDIIGSEEIEQCRLLCDKYQLELVVREYR
jgi:radical SAM protein, TatD family-associated